MRVGLFTTGGTIGMREVVGGGVAPADGARATLAGLPELGGVAVEPYDIFAKPSASISLLDLRALAERIEAGFADGLEAAVVTHGTDTIEESAFALALMLGATRPVVMTGAMRSPDQSGTDGPANLLSAIRVAMHPEAADHGVLVLFGVEIHSAGLVRKVHSSRVHAFSSDPYGPVGHVFEGRVEFVMKLRVPLPRLLLAGAPPAVPILQAGLDLEPVCVAAFANPSIGALVLAGVGGGHVSAASTDALEELARRVPVVITTRAAMGPTLRASYAYVGGDIDLARRGLLNGGRWSSSQARILLQLLLSGGPDEAFSNALTLDEAVNWKLARG